MDKTQLSVREEPPISTPRTVLSMILEGFVRLRDGRIMYVVRRSGGSTNVHPVWSDKTIARVSIADSLNLNREVHYVDANKIGIEKIVWSE